MAKGRHSCRHFKICVWRGCVSRANVEGGSVLPAFKKLASFLILLLFALDSLLAITYMSNAYKILAKNKENLSVYEKNILLYETYFLPSGEELSFSFHETYRSKNGGRAHLTSATHSQG